MNVHTDDLFWHHNANEFMKIIPSNVISKSIFPLACSYHKSSFSINIDVHSINTDVEFFEIASLENCASIFPRGSHVPRVFRRLQNFVVSARLLRGRRTNLLRNNNLCYLKACKEVTAFPTSLISAQFSKKLWRVPNTLRNESHHKIISSIWHTLYNFPLKNK